MDDIIDYLGQTSDLIGEYTIEGRDVPYKVAEEIEIRINTAYSRLLRLKHFYTNESEE